MSAPDKSDKENMPQDKVPGFFLSLIESGTAQVSDTVKTEDGFYALNRCISDILKTKNITTFFTEDGTELECDKYFDDWYFYAIEDKGRFVYSLFKLREQEYDMYEGEKADRDTPGVTVSFIAFDTAVFSECIENICDSNTTALSDEINRVVAYSGQSHHPVLKKYFLATQAKGAYVIAELYVKHITSFTHKGFIIVPQKYEELHNETITLKKGDRKRRLPDFIDENNKKAGTVVCDHEKIYIKDPQNPDIYESLAILATHTADTSFNCFAAEVQYHALFLVRAARIRIPFFGISVYESAIRADLSIDDSEFEGTAPYHRQDSKLVLRQVKIHGER